MNDDIGAQQLVVIISVAALGFILNTLAQTGALEDALQNQLAPVALDFLVSFKRLREIGSFFGDLAVQFLQGFDLTP